MARASYLASARAMARWRPATGLILRRPVAGFLSAVDSHWRWHLDEVFVKINGETHNVWRAVDHEGEILESFVTKTCDKKSTLKFIKK